MTVKELYEFMKSQGKEDYRIIIQYRDDGGEYHGQDDDVYVIVSDNKKTITL